MKVNKYIEDKEHIEVSKQLCLIGALIIFCGLFFGYWTAFHIYGDDGDIDTTETNITETKEDTNKDQKMEELIKKLDELTKKVDETEDQLTELKKEKETEDQLTLKLWEITEEIKTLKEELTEPENLEKSGEEEPVILDTETQYQYYPYIMAIIGLLIIQIFKKQHS